MSGSKYRLIAVIVALAFLPLSGKAQYFGFLPVEEPSYVPTFNKDIAPIFYAYCTECHRPGQVAPMSLLTFRDARPWARLIAERVAQGAMPPWHADPGYGEFQNDRRLDDVQKTLIAQWVRSGAPEGDPKDLPPPPSYAESWTIGRPDAVVSMVEDYTIPASGTLPYKYFQIRSDFTEDKWLKGVEIMPGNRSVVHHILLYVRPTDPPHPMQVAAAPSAPRQLPIVTFAPGMDIPAGQTGGPELPTGATPASEPNDRPAPRPLGDWLAAYVPGNSARTFAAGSAMRLPARSTLVLQVHYATKGVATTDRTRVGLVFANDPPSIELHRAALVNGSLRLKPGSPDERVDAEMTAHADVTIWSMWPHTHTRGKRWDYEVVWPDGRRQTILSIPRYNFDWQTDYVFRQPLVLNAGAKLHAVAWFDNSRGNKQNPDPTKEVTWGDQTTDEMMFTGLVFSVGAPASSHQ